MKLLKFALYLLLMSIAPIGTQAQIYPSKDIHIICTFPAGSGADVLVRFFAEKLRTTSGATVVVENKPGAVGSIGTQYVARRPPDGHTILLDAGTSIAGIMARFKTPPVDVTTELQMVATLNKQAFMIVVDANSPYKTLKDLTDALKQQGDTASYAAAAPSGIVLGELYKAEAGLNTVRVNYASSADSMNDLLSGRIAFGSLDPVFSLAQVRQGRLRALAIGSGERMQSIPEIPTLKEAGLPIDVTTWWSVSVPAGTPRPTIDQLNAWFNDILKQEDTKKFLNNSGGDPFISTPDETQALFLKAVKEWGEYIRLAKIPQAG